MELKVRDIGTKKEKSAAEIEQELLDKAAATQKGKGEDNEGSNNKKPNEDGKENIEEARQKLLADLKDEDVLSFIETKHKKAFKSVDELLAPKEIERELPPDVQAFAKFHAETGRGIEDFVRLSKDFDKMQGDDLLRDYFRATEDGLDGEDIEAMIHNFDFEEGVDDDTTIKQRKLAKKQAISKAKKFFKEQKETYKKPLESRQVTVAPEDLEDLKTYRDLVSKAKSKQEEDDHKRTWFQKKTEEIFGSEFKGFEFTVKSGTKEAPVEKKFIFTPADAAELKKANASPMNFINKFLDEKGLMKDAAGYHRALSIAMNPERFAQFFYEQGQADATDNVMRKTKNIDMSERKAPEVARRGEMTIKAVTPESGHGLKIRSPKNK